MSKRSLGSLSRRTFLRGTAAALSVPMILPKSVFGANDKLNIAWVGIGGMGWGDLRSCAEGNNIVAICDCDPSAWGKAKTQFPSARFYKDFRVMLNEMGKEIDAVGVGTPDHNHFAVAYMALSMGKHVFVEKPLVHSIWEARTLQKLAKDKNAVTQMGNQGHASEGARLIKEWYEAGLIGEVKEVIAWTNRPAKGFGFDGNVQTAYPEAGQPPADMDWNLWLGSCNLDLGYSAEFHPKAWRRWWAFGCGGLGDIGCHTLDTPYWALDLGAPESIDVEMNGEVNPIFTPNGSVVSYNFTAHGNKPPVKIKWYEGPSRPEIPSGFDGTLASEGGMIMIGEKGGICHDGMRPDSPKLYPADRWEEYRTNADKRVPKTLPRTKGIHKDWLTAIKEGKKSCSDFSYSAPLTEVILLGTLAIRTGKSLKWDAAAMKISDNDGAADMIEIETREGWRTKDLG